MAERSGGAADDSVAALVELGLHHEQQHQELLLMDIKQVLSCNPLQPAYLAAGARRQGSIAPDAWVSFEGGLIGVGHDGDGFAYDNELPRHRAYVAPYWLGARPVSCGAWLEITPAGGCHTPPLSQSGAVAKVTATDRGVQLQRRRGVGDG